MTKMSRYIVQLTPEIRLFHRGGPISFTEEIDSCRQLLAVLTEHARVHHIPMLDCREKGVTRNPLDSLLGTEQLGNGA
jgi:hypothetical protein